jgi:hypothetical protein
VLASEAIGERERRQRGDDEADLRRRIQRADRGVVEAKRFEVEIQIERSEAKREGRERDCRDVERRVARVR